jgi:hypothetical protein
MERRFSIEAKSFLFSSKNGSPLFRLEERRKNFLGYIFVSTQGASWLVDTVEAACQGKENMAKSFREGDKALMVHGGANKAGRFLEVAVFAEGGRKGGVWLPEGRDGRGWRRFAGELQRFLVSGSGSEVAGKSSLSSAKPIPTNRTEAVESGECFEHRSFAEVLKSSSRTRVEAINGGDETLNSMDGEIDRSLQAAAGSGRKSRGKDVTEWVDKLLGFAQLGLGRAVAGLLEGILDGPRSINIRSRIWAVLKRLKGLKGGGLGPPSLSTRCGVNGVGPGRLKRVRMKPVGKSTQQAPEVCAGGEPPVPERGVVEVASTSSEGCLGATIGDGSTPGVEAVLGASIGDGLSPARSLEVSEAVLGTSFGDGSSPARSLEVSEAVLSEGCVEATIGDGSSPARSLEVSEAVLGASDDGCPVEVGSSSVAVLPKGPEPSVPVSASTPVVPVSAQIFSVAPVSAQTSPTSPSLDSKMVPVKKKGSSGPENSMIRRGFFGPSSDSPKNPSLTQNLSEDSMTLAQLAKVAKQLQNNKELLAESEGVSQVGTKGYSKKVLDSMKFAPVVGMTWGGEDNKMLEMFSDYEKRKHSAEVSTPKVKGLREHKNLNCQRRRGFLGSDDDSSFPPEVH